MELLLILLESLVLTIFIESLLGWVIGIRERKDRLLLVLVNLLTNPLVVCISYFARGLMNQQLWIVNLGLECMAVLVEGHYYKCYGKQIRTPWLTSLLLNVVSYGCGTLIR